MGNRQTFIIKLTQTTATQGIFLGSTLWSSMNEDNCLPLLVSSLHAISYTMLQHEVSTQILFSYTVLVSFQPLQLSHLLSLLVILIHVVLGCPTFIFSHDSKFSGTIQWISLSCLWTCFFSSSICDLFRQKSCGLPLSFQLQYRGIALILSSQYFATIYMYVISETQFQYIFQTKTNSKREDDLV